MKNIEAREFMSDTDVITVPSVCQVEVFEKVLRGTSHHAFPVVNSANNVVGLIPKKIIVNLLIMKAFYHKDVISSSCSYSSA